MMAKEEENTSFSCQSLTLYLYSRTIKLYFFHLFKSITVTRLFRGWKILEIQWSTLKHTVEKSNIGGAILWTPKNKTKKITHRITWRPDKGFWEGEAKQGLFIVNATFSETLLPPTPPLQKKYSKSRKSAMVSKTNLEKGLRQFWPGSLQLHICESFPTGWVELYCIVPQ